MRRKEKLLLLHFLHFHQKATFAWEFFSFGLWNSQFSESSSKQRFKYHPNYMYRYSWTFGSDFDWI